MSRGTDDSRHSCEVDDTDRLREAWEAAEAALANATDPVDVVTLEATAEAANEAYIRAEEARALRRLTRRES